jgi:hypothetical protein
MQKYFKWTLLCQCIINHAINSWRRSNLKKFFLAELEFELRALHLLGKPFTTEDMPPDIFALVIFQ